MKCQRIRNSYKILKSREETTRVTRSGWEITLRVYLKRNRMGVRGIDSWGSGYVPVVGYCDRSNEFLGPDRISW
jgi:hypothetical protein